jgi:hypothetical protein
MCQEAETDDSHFPDRQFGVGCSRTAPIRTGFFEAAGFNVRINRNRNGAEVAQLVEQPIRNRQVASSSLALGSNLNVFCFR